MKRELTPLIVFVAAVATLTAVVVWTVPASAVGYSPIVIGDNTTIITDNEIITDKIVVNEGDNTTIIADNELITDNIVVNEDLTVGGRIISSQTVTRHEFIPSCEFGKPTTDPPVVAVYGICQALEFSVGTDKAYYKRHVPDDWVPGTDILVHVHWTRSSTGSDDSTKTVNWQLKNLVINGASENCQTGESTDSVQDAYDSSSTTDQIVYMSDDMTIAAAEISAGGIVILELMAVTPTGTPLADPAAVGLGITYTGYQVLPA
ncbi:hypothetical protein ES706_02352 [subsurface metagenome]